MLKTNTTLAEIHVMKITNPKDLFNNLAKEYQDKFMDFDLYYDTFDLLCNLIETKNASVLEIGCGPGNISKYLLNKRPDFNLLGIDIAPNMIKLAKNNNPTATFKLMDCKNILQLKAKFDAIVCGFTLPYLNKKEAFKLIEDASELINPNGLLYVSTMEDDYEKSKIITRSDDKSIGLFTYYHQADYLTERLQQKGFKIVHLERKDFPDAKDSSKDLIIIAIKD